MTTPSCCRWGISEEVSAPSISPRTPPPITQTSGKHRPGFCEMWVIVSVPPKLEALCGLCGRRIAHA